VGGDTTGTTDRPVSPKRAWFRFVKARRVELHDQYPCAMPTSRRLCPKHGTRVGPITQICKPCRDQLYEQLADEYLAATGGRKETAMTTDTDANDPQPSADDNPTAGELELYQAPATPAGLFGTDNPRAVIAKATEISDELARVIHDKRLYARIAGKEHVLVEGWTLLGSMLGLYPYTVWTKRLEDGWEARVEARTVHGRAIAAAEAECLRAERKWAKADDYALRSMSQTRATSKALRQPLGFVMQLAGFEATPAEEMPAEPTTPLPEPDQGKIPAASRPTREQMARISQLLIELAEHDPGTDWKAEARRIAGVPGDMLTGMIADMLIGRLEQELGERT
jgi:hypothetical protein